MSGPEENGRVMRSSSGQSAKLGRVSVTAQPRTEEKRSRNDEPPKDRSLAGCVFVADPCGDMEPGVGVKDAGPPGARTALSGGRREQLSQ